jgi:hypothetical protein
MRGAAPSARANRSPSPNLGYLKGNRADVNRDSIRTVRERIRWSQDSIAERRSAPLRIRGTELQNSSSPGFWYPAACRARERFNYECIRTSVFVVPTSRTLRPGTQHFNYFVALCDAHNMCGCNNLVGNRRGGTGEMQPYVDLAPRSCASCAARRAPRPTSEGIPPFRFSHCTTFVAQDRDIRCSPEHGTRGAVSGRSLLFSST